MAGVGRDRSEPVGLVDEKGPEDLRVPLEGGLACELIAGGGGRPPPGAAIWILVPGATAPPCTASLAQKPSEGLRRRGPWLPASCSTWARLLTPLDPTASPQR